MGPILLKSKKYFDGNSYMFKDLGGILGFLNQILKFWVKITCFLSFSSKNHAESSRNFVKNLILNPKRAKLNPKRALKSLTTMNCPPRKPSRKNTPFSHGVSQAQQVADLPCWPAAAPAPGPNNCFSNSQSGDQHWSRPQPQPQTQTRPQPRPQGLSPSLGSTIGGSSRCPSHCLVCFFIARFICCCFSLSLSLFAVLLCLTRISQTFTDVIPS